MSIAWLVLAITVQAAAKPSPDASVVFVAQVDVCRNAITTANRAVAEKACLTLPALAEQLPASSQLERAGANDLAGTVHFALERFGEALAAFERALAARLKNVKPGDPADVDVGMTYHRIGWAHRRLNNAAEARRQYELAESTVRKALEWANALPRDRNAELRQEFRERYKANLLEVLRDLIALLQESGDAPAAAAAQRRLDSIK